MVGRQGRWAQESSVGVDVGVGVEVGGVLRYVTIAVWSPKGIHVSGDHFFKFLNVPR